MLDIRPLLVLAVCLAVAGCHHGTGEQSARVELGEQVRLTCAGEAWDAYGNFLPVIRISNGSTHDISYAGYSTSYPVYDRQVRGSDAEEWRDQKMGWCGVGLDRQRLGAGQSATFTLLPPEGVQSWRIGVKIVRPAVQEIWTGPIPAKAGEVVEAPGPGELVRTDVVRHPGREYPYTFTLTNVSPRPLFYGGFREPDVPPIYLHQESRSNVWQDEGSANWSGTGFGFKELPPGGSISFSIPAQSLDSTWRIGVRLFKTARPVAHDDAYGPVWWGPLPPRDRA